MRIALLAALLLVPPCFAGSPLPDGPHVVTSGEGKVTIAPDLATITLQVRHRDMAAATAKQRVDAAIEAFLRAAPGFGLATTDVTASDLSLSEDIDYDDAGRRRNNGFVASRAVTVELRQLHRLGEFIDSALAAGLNSVENVVFASSHKAELQREARAKAVAGAREEASGLAHAFGSEAGAIYSINSVHSHLANGYGGRLDRIVVTGARLNAGKYLQPSVEYTERVSAVFELERK
ncbi:hypothetical protein N792_12125 [Lysobacter concretionis Ko07 = DSM 16239]|uniref:SIMPL domain-containing protein n=1 Tax=Lysobacter concretionis Ko07 = DSM 16239 TaxID=1122185 RepID=A0A0A0ELW0_9GAMM|nr:MULTISPECIES: SIMPL domain-containing protein [Lysobacter]KGM51133.1 hypothetical protein N792_12125 [Lysobacter concretionis Ko07 = DSM 16239]QOD90881.1 SIMPL domain-containing protein [Lysobacter sp. CW239]